MKKDKSRFDVGSWVKRYDGTIGMTVVEISLNHDDTDKNRIKCKFKDPEGIDHEAIFPEKDLVEL